MLLALHMLVMNSGFAADFSVGPTQPYTDISSALAVAVSGDRILVDPGTYVESLSLNTDVELIGTGGSAVTTLAATAGAIEVLLIDANATVQGFQIDGLAVARGIEVASGTVALDDLIFTNTGGVSGSALYLRAGVTTLDNATMMDPVSGALEGGHIYLENSASLFSNGGLVVENGSATAQGGGLFAQGATVDLTGCVFRGNSATGIDIEDGGGAIFAEESSADIRINNCTIESNSAADDGGGVQIRQGTLTIVDTLLSNNDAAKGGHLMLSMGANATVEGSTLELGTASEMGGAIYSFNSDMGVSDTLFQENEANGDGGAISATGSGVELTRSVLCGNTTLFGDGSGVALGFGIFDTSSLGLIAGNVFIEGASPTGAAALWEYSSIPIQNNTFYGNEASSTAAVASVDLDSNWVNNLLVEHPLGPTAITDGTVFGGAATFSYNAFWQNLGGDTDFSLDSTNLTGMDPLLLGYVPGSCDPAGLLPLSGSPVIDAGDPSISDADGSPSDIGAFGGPSGLTRPTDVDADGDGFDQTEDCDDNDAAINPNAVEVCDGIDQDCDGIVDDDTDTDGDGTSDLCDPCPLDSNDDSDSDSVCDSDDICPDHDDLIDTDDDGVPDGCDLCSEGDDALDSDADLIPDDCDNCDGDNRIDSDGDTVPDACDQCPGQDDNELQDLNGDGVLDDCTSAQTGDPTPTTLPPRFFCGCETGTAPAAPWTVLALGLVLLRRRP